MIGPNAVQNPAALVSALKSQAPPSNPRTPLERLNPDQQALEHIKAASVSLERAQQFTNDPNMILVLNAMGGTLSKALLKFDGQTVMQSLQEATQSFPPAVAPAQAGSSPGASPAMPGQGAPPAAPPGMAAPPSMPTSAPGGPLA
jgi:hypothetical protein